MGDGGRGMPRGSTRSVVLLAALLATLGAAACERRAETPPEVARAYDELQSTLDPLAPGAAFARLQEFAREHARYAIAATVERDVGIWRQRLETAYRQARDMAREDEFERAEEVLKDLALAGDERTAPMAEEFLAFDFYYLKATRLLQKGDVEAAEAAARVLREKRLTQEQSATIERLLDQTATVGTGIAMTRAAALDSAARLLQVALHSTYADDGQYPASLAADGPLMTSLRDTGAFSDVVGSIEGYAATRDGFSLVVVGKDARQRIRVTQSRIEALSPTRD